MIISWQVKINREKQIRHRKGALWWESILTETLKMGQFQNKICLPWKSLAQLNAGFGLEYTVRFPSQFLWTQTRSNLLVFGHNSRSWFLWPETLLTPNSSEDSAGAEGQGWIFLHAQLTFWHPENPRFSVGLSTQGCISSWAQSEQALGCACWILGDVEHTPLAGPWSVVSSTPTSAGDSSLLGEECSSQQGARYFIANWNYRAVLASKNTDPA